MFIAASGEGNFSECGEICDGGRDHWRGGQHQGASQGPAARQPAAPRGGRPGQEGDARGLQRQQTCRQTGGEVG